MSARASVVCVAFAFGCHAPRHPSLPADKAPFESLEFRKLAVRDAKGWPEFEIYNLGKRRVAAVDVVVYAYDAHDKQIDRSWGVRVTQPIEPGAHVTAEVTDNMREVYPLARGAAAFDVCYEGITFDGDPVVYRSRCANARPRGARAASPGGVVAIAAHPLFPWDGQFNWPWIPRAFDEPLIDAFERAHAGVMIDLDDGWSSSPLRPGRDANADLALATSPAQVRPGQHAIPIGLTAVAILYHVNGVDHLRLSAEAVAGIFDGTIKTWNDPVIAKDNPEAKLPSIAIVARRAGEERQISAALARYVARAAPGAWHLKPNAPWPEGVPFNSLDTSRVEAAKNTNGAITYLAWPLAHAFAVPVASIENHAGRWVAPTASTTTAAADDVSVDDQLGFDPVATDSPGAYPIVYASWAAVDDTPSDPDKGQWLRTYLEFLLGDGQNVLVEGDYGRLSAAVVERARRAVLSSPARAVH